MRLRCFIAMASGKIDTDKLYKGQIKPALRRHQVTPVLVEQQEHNDDIDDRIISELRTCDFAIADLTYSRPSVYFEAGFAQRAVPVIYTCRADHFQLPSADDIHELHRVHFDLQMKNIIRWLSPVDEKFAARLNRRIAAVVLPLMAFRKEQDAEREEVNAFNSLLVKERLKSVLDACINALKQARYRGGQFDSKFFGSAELFDALASYEGRRGGWGHVMTFSSFNMTYGWSSRLSRLRNAWTGSRSQKAVIRSATVVVTDSLTKATWDGLWRSLFEAPSYDISSMLNAGQLEKMVEHFFLCSLSRGTS